MTTEIQRRRAETIMASKHGTCGVCLTTETPGQPCDCQCPTCTTAQAPTAPRFAITEAARGWEWTYTNIRAADAQHIADLLNERSGETWTVTKISH